MVRRGSPVRIRHWASPAPDEHNPTATHEKPSRAQRMAEGLHERRERHRERSTPYRAVVVVAGVLITVAGLVMTGPVPGPGVLVIPIGLALLALEFDWAERLMHRALAYADRTGDRASSLSTRAKVLIGVAVALVVGGAVVLALTIDVPLLPV